MDADGGNAKQVTNLATEADGVLFSPDGKNLVFTSEVYPGLRRRRCLQSRNSGCREEQQGQSPHLHRSALSPLDHVAERKRRSHLLVDAGRAAARPRISRPASATCRRSRSAAPTITTSRPTGKEVCLFMNADPVPGHQHQFRSLRGAHRRAAQSAKITSTSGADNSPALFARRQVHRVARADPRRVRERPLAADGAGARHRQGRRTSPRRSTAGSNSFTWSPDSARIFFTTDDRGRQAIQLISVTGGGMRDRGAAATATLDDMQFTPRRQDAWSTRGRAASRPTEIYRAASTRRGAPPR